MPRSLSVARKKVQVWIHTERPGSERRFLLLKLRRERGGFWQPVTGGVEKGERSLAAAARESDEESSLTFDGAPIPVDHSFVFRKGEQSFVETVFRRQVIAGRSGVLKLDPNEHIQSEWVSAKEALARLSFDSNRDALRAVLKSLGDA
ncbi:MAG TPA: NUDIX domain-containing protein [Bdellovibrionota bacterium]|jgi:8-oxo-dGTP pyrophosphatase MutT (NUDIX family)|nr:NUDIX domain-containing protein [Bdellovibrionota bacterium]